MTDNFTTQTILKSLPDAPGVYLMKSESGEVIYVGKAKNLAKRVRSYFNRSVSDAKTKALVANIRDIEIRQTESEVEAFILENDLIKRFKPQYNVDLKDGRTYPFLAISQEKFPRVYITRDRPDSEAVFFGPFVDVNDLYESINMLQEVFKFRTTNRNIDIKPYRRPCLNHALGRCTAPCVGKVTEEDYAQQIERFKLFLRGKKRNLIKKLEQEMQVFSQELRFEEAAQRRDYIKALHSLNKGKRLTRKRIQEPGYRNPSLSRSVAEKKNGYGTSEQIGLAVDIEEGLVELQKLFYLPDVPRIIEGIDISNTSGRESVGSVVHFRDGLPFSSNYRNFKIKSVKGPNDFASIHEVVLRHYGRICREKGEFPHMILIDGGKGQLGEAQAALTEIAKKWRPVPSFLLSIAKREEELFTVGRDLPVLLPRNSIALRILQSVRDESHRFAQRYHKRLRSKGSLGT